LLDLVEEPLDQIAGTPWSFTRGIPRGLFGKNGLMAAHS